MDSAVQSAASELQLPPRDVESLPLEDPRTESAALDETSLSAARVPAAGIADQKSPDWRQRLSVIIETMREMSRHTDPQAMVGAYSERMREIFPVHRRIGLSRRGLADQKFRITRYSEWTEQINPWKEADRLPLLSGGTLAKMLYHNEPTILNDFQPAADDPALEYLAGQRSLLAIPLFDQGESLNMVVLTHPEPGAFDEEVLPDTVWRANLFGRATHNLVLAEQLKEAYNFVDRELQVVADMQRSLLPATLPKIPGFELAAWYQTSRRAGGDYYDVFELPNGHVGILIADVSGHGTPAAVMMAVTHAIAHTYPGSPSPPSSLLQFVNNQLCRLYTANSGVFVTAFYGIYDPQERMLTYSSAGHNPPRLKHCSTGSVYAIDKARHMPLGIMAEEEYSDATLYFQIGDQLVLYTDGITEASNPNGELFGSDRLDNVLDRCRKRAGQLIHDVIADVREFTGDAPQIDDQTMLVAVIS